jgi:hypothetical protein
MLLLIQEVSKLKKQAFTLRLVYREKKAAMRARSGVTRGPSND